MRKSLNPSFNPKVLQSFVPIFNEKSFLLIEKLSDRIGESNVEMIEYMLGATMDMILYELIFFFIEF